ncbi:MAG: tyrosine-type recombinase/integrase, partial [Cyanobacteria bacterium J06649_11]
FSDAASLAARNISKTPKGLYYSSIMKKNQRRAPKEISLPVYAFFHWIGEEKSRAQLCLERCLVRYGRSPGTPLFGELYNSKVNQELKSIAELAGIAKNLTTHVGRHSFGTNMAAVNVPPSLLQAYMGHSKLETTQLYIHMAGKIKDDVMEKIKFG